MNILVGRYLLLLSGLTGLAVGQLRAGDSLVWNARELFNQGLYREAAEKFEQALLLNQQPTEGLDTGLLKSLILSQQLQRAEEMAVIFLRRQGKIFTNNYVKIVYLLARIKLLQNDLATALKIFTRLIQQYPQTELARQSYFWLAEILRQQGYFTESQNLFLWLQSNYPDHQLSGIAHRGLLLIDTALIKQQVEQALSERDSTP